MDFTDIKIETVISYSALAVSFISVLLVSIQVKYLRRQLEFDSRLKLTEINRQILTLGFSDPDLFKILNGVPVDQEKEKRYCQLWVNQMDISWHAQKVGMYDKDFFSGLERDIADTFQLDTMLRHWKIARMYYSEGFRQYIDRIIEKNNVEAQSKTLRTSSTEPSPAVIASPMVVPTIQPAANARASSIRTTPAVKPPSTAIKTRSRKL